MGAADHVAALRGLVAGELAGWHGLPQGLALATLEQALGRPEAPSAPGYLAGMPAASLTYPGGAGAPFGVQAWLEGERVVALQVRDPAFPASPQEQLGAPEADAPSGLGSSYRQHVWAGRGLTVHVSEVMGTARRLYAYAPTTAQEFLDGPLGRVEERRIPRR